MTASVGRKANQRKIPKWLPFKNYKSESLIFDVHMLGTYVHMCTKYEVSMSNHVPGGRCAQTMMPMPTQDNANDNSGQSMIV